MNMLRSLSLVAAIVAVGCGTPSNPSACANKAMCTCGAGRYCENGGSWSRCTSIPDEPASCGSERWPGECRERKCVAQAGEDAGPGGTDVLATDAPIGVDAPGMVERDGSTETGTSTAPDGGDKPASCTNGQTRSCALDGVLGNCAKGTETCTGGAWGPCSISPATADKCDVAGDDANCNGKPNEGCPCINGNTQPCGPSATQGICKRGTQACNNGQWGACEGAVYAKTRDCASSMDNDCDGKVDDAIDGTCQCPINGSRPCGTHPQDGVGRCRAGTQTCVAGAGNASSSWGVCSGSVGPASADTCEPNDDSNCNGTKNEGCNCANGTSRSCAQDGRLGNCGKGTESCVNGTWGACSVSPQPSDRCDVVGDDSNCNGKTNEGCRTLGQGCSSNGDCQSVHCVMGVCCGTTCPAATPGSCGNDGTCDSNGVCRKYGSTTMCSPASCSDRSNSREAGFCQGGSCQPGAMCDYHGCGTNSKCTNKCPDGTIDTGSQCAPCGGIDQSCCQSGTPCRATHSICDVRFSKCIACGAVAQMCCGLPNTNSQGWASQAGDCHDGSICTEHAGFGWSCDD